MTARWKVLIISFGILSAIALAAQLALALMILSGGGTAVRKAHQHTGYLTVAITLLYLALSLATVIRIPIRSRG
jgi:hypothetical protein